MDIRTIGLTVDLYNITVPCFVLKQGDTTVLNIEVLARGEPFPLGGLSVTLNAVRADNTAFVQQTGITVSGSTATASLDEAVTAVAGELRLEVYIEDETSLISTFIIGATVDPALITGQTVAENAADRMISALELSARAPYIGESGNWQQYDGSTGGFVDTGRSAKGDTGATFVPAVSPGGELSWTNDGGLPNPAPVNVKGATGAKGDTGSDANVTADNITAALGYNPANVGVISPWYEGVDLTQKFAAEIAGYSDVWVWIKARITAANYTGIHINDYIPFVTTNNVTVKACVAGIDTYYCYGDSSVGHHIDFISRDCWPTKVQMNKTNYNNGLIPVEKLSGDGTITAFVMTRQMTAIDNITVDGEQVTAFTYDFATSTVTFDAAPASGSNNIVVTGTGTQHPWLASNAYAYLNSLAMQVPNGTGANPAITQVDYTANGVYYYLPAALKSVIVEKRMLLPTRYSATGVLTSDNSWAWANMGKLWLPSEVEIAGCPIWGDKGYGAGGFVQYPVFACNMNRLKGLGNGGSRYYWWTLSACSGTSTFFVLVTSRGYVGNSTYASSAIGAPVCFRIDDSTAA